MKNCYDGYGADGSDTYSHSMSLFDCKQACEVDDSCEGIIVGVGIIKEGRGRCHKRKNIQPCDCQDKAGYNLFIKVAYGQSTTSTTCTTNTTTAATSNADKTADLAELIFFSNWQTVAKVGSHCCARLQLSLIHCQSWLCTLPHKPLLSNPPNPPQDRTLGRIDFFKVFRVAKVGSLCCA